MKKYFKRKYDLSDKGASDLVKAIFSCTLTDLSFMFPVGLLYITLEEFIGRYIDKNTNMHSIFLYIVASIIFLLLIYLFEKIQYNATFLASYEESANKRIAIAERLRKIPLSFFGKRDLADLTTTIMSDCAALEKAFSHFIPQLYGSVFSVILVGIGLLCFNYKLAIALLWVVPVSFIFIFMGKRKLKVNDKIVNDIKVENDINIQECIENIKEIKGYNQEEKYLKHIKDNIVSHEKAHIKCELITGIIVTTAQMFLKVGIATLALMGAKLISDGSLDFLTLLMFLIAASRVFDPLAISLQNLVAIYATELKTDRMKEIENEKAQEGSEEASLNNYDIDFNNVTFAYEGNDNVIDNVSFVAKQGQVTALVGPSGGGKSTCLKLAARFWDINSGNIKIGNKNISDIEIEELLSKYSIVFQDVVLFNNTIMENIRLGKRGASDEEVMKAAKFACCDEFVSKMPNGYNTVIGENGSMLSGGERQRLSIARALLKDAPIILLDEATASLDVENESKVQEALSRLIKNKTVLVVAHRMRTIQEADHIVVLKDGKVSEEGTHNELMNNDGVYNRLWNLQMKSSNWKIS